MPQLDYQSTAEHPTFLGGLPDWAAGMVLATLYFAGGALVSVGIAWLLG